ncbi:MAG TPA: class I SAM-dependent methyltransferase [Mycobacteriales bacterium]|jgi:predicted O-methyltransferase YrrM|nr:class I SAM-dependent methyltransferase [Mycobacteriales bacterium]
MKDLLRNPRFYLLVGAAVGGAAVAVALFGAGAGVVVVAGLTAAAVAVGLRALRLHARHARELKVVRAEVGALDAELKLLRTTISRASSAVAGSDSEVVRRLDSLDRRLTRGRAAELAQIEAMINLHSVVRVSQAMPASGGGWAVPARTLLELCALVIERRPQTIVECGSGVSTVWLASTVRQCGYGARIISLEHLEEHRDKTLAEIRRHGLETLVDVRSAPLSEVVIDGTPWTWYDVRALDDVEECDLLFVDGPPGTTGVLARYPALPVLKDRLTADAVVVLDDVDRPDEKQTVEKWSEQQAWRRVVPIAGPHAAVILYR